jgi:TfoX/Sxy family transcriptional regulator of competence genes
MGIRSVADTGFRLGFGGKRRILVFTGQSAETTAEQQKALMDVQMGRLQGDLDPMSLVKSMITAGRAVRDMPGQLRRGQEAREAWEHLFTADVRRPKPSRARAAPSRRPPAVRQPTEHGRRKPADAALPARTPRTRTSTSTKTAAKVLTATEEDRERFRALVPQAPSVTVKSLFGNLSAFVNGNMFMGVFGSDIGLKLPPHEQARLLAEPGSGPFGPAERPRDGYVTIPATWSPDQAGPWIEKSLALVAALPPKKPKERAKTS